MCYSFIIFSELFWKISNPPRIRNTVWLLYIYISYIYEYIIYIILYSFLDVSSVDTWPHLLYLSLPVDFCVNTHIFSCWDIWGWVAGIVLPHPKYFNIFSKNQDIYHSFPVGCTILHSCWHIWKFQLPSLPRPVLLNQILNTLVGV